MKDSRPTSVGAHAGDYSPNACGADGAAAIPRSENVGNRNATQTARRADVHTTTEAAVSVGVGASRRRDQPGETGDSEVSSHTHTIPHTHRPLHELDVVETARLAQRLTRLQTVALMAKQHLDEELPQHAACDCTRCCLQAALDQLEEGDV